LEPDCSRIDLQRIRRIQRLTVLGSQHWDNGFAGGAGTATITAISATRVTGTFNVTLVDNPINVVPVATANLTNGQFDMALERF
jgi:hypothetical protein